MANLSNCCPETDSCKKSQRGRDQPQHDHREEPLPLHQRPSGGDRDLYQGDMHLTMSTLCKKKCRSYLKSPPFLYFVTLGNIADITYELPTGTRPATRRAARTRTGWGSSSTKSSRRTGPTCSRRGCSSFTPGSRSTPTSETLQGCQKV